MPTGDLCAYLCDYRRFVCLRETCVPTCVTTGDLCAYLCDYGRLVCLRETGVPGEAVAVTVSSGVVP